MFKDVQEILQSLNHCLYSIQFIKKVI